MGYNYHDDFGLAPSDIAAFSKDNNALGQKLERGRCDLVPERCEIIRGFSSIGKPMLSEYDLSYDELPGGRLTPFYMMFPKSKLGHELRDIFNSGIRHMETTGQMAQLRAVYGLHASPDSSAK